VGGDYNFAWPTAEIAVVGAEAAVNLLYRKELSGDDSKEKFDSMVAQYRGRFANPNIASEQGYIDDIILPTETRNHLIAALEILRNKRVERPKRKHGNIPL